MRPRYISHMRNSGARRLTFGVFIYIQTFYWRAGNAMASLCICKDWDNMICVTYLRSMRHLSTFYRTSLSVNFGFFSNTFGCSWDRLAYVSLSKEIVWKLTTSFNLRASVWPIKKTYNEYQDIVWHAHICHFVAVITLIDRVRILGRWSNSVCHCQTMSSSLIWGGQN